MKITKPQLRQIIMEELSIAVESQTERAGIKSNDPSFGTQARVYAPGKRPGKEIRQKVAELLGPYIKELLASEDPGVVNSVESAVSDLFIGRGELRREDVTEQQLKQMIEEELESDPALKSAIDRLASKIEDLDVSLDYLTSAITGEDTLAIALGQKATGRFRQAPRAQVTPAVKESHNENE